ncbi:hypothetical protein, partial [Pandoraea sp. CB10b_02]|uniref:hypothetical protein n=1 Tax=Pandoraea sp. CB10b_02 TaxID=2014535 RepID=UPI00257D5393
MRIPIACGWRRMPGFLLFWSTDSHEDIERTRLPGAHLPMRIGCGGSAPAASLQYGAMWRNTAPAERLQRARQLRHHGKQIAHQTVVRHREDRR